MRTGTMKTWIWYAVGFLFLTLALLRTVSANDNFGDDALWKRTIRTECKNRGYTEAECLCLEPWFKKVDQINVCKNAHSYMAARYDIAYDIAQKYDWYAQMGLPGVWAWWTYDGTDYLGVINDTDVTMYLVPHLAVFHEEAKAPWDDLCDAAANATLSADHWMFGIPGHSLGVVKQVDNLYQGETYYRRQVGLPPLKKPEVPQI